jgi:predicted nucleic acid-binding Zn ribbon protein
LAFVLVTLFLFLGSKVCSLVCQKIKEKNKNKNKNLQGICLHMIYQDTKLKIIYHHLSHNWIKTSRLNGLILLLMKFQILDIIIALIPLKLINFYESNKDVPQPPPKTR